MKVGLLGAGKTGSKVIELHDDVVVFSSASPPGADDFSQCDVIICFVPGEVFLTYMPALIESGVPVVAGATGFDWPPGIGDELKNKGLKWVRGHNFSLGMNLVKAMIQIVSNADNLYKDYAFAIHDIHHVHKKDAPSGTALSWQQWLGHEAEITAERTGDVVGYHHLELDTPQERIRVTHEAKDRAVFAAGALWAANKLVSDADIETGLLEFNHLVTRYLHI